MTLLSPSSSPFLIAGLGNPGREYRDTRHNVGFMALDRLAARLGVTFSRLEAKALFTRAEYQGRRILLAKPQTYMNLSGQAVGALLRYYKAPLSNLLVIYDDVDLPLGVLRLRPAGGSAGQKGMRSIIERLGVEAIPRLRIGIGRPPGHMDAADYVLQEFSREEQENILAALDRAADAALKFTLDGLEAAMNQFNGEQSLEG
ncbi:MAG: aminoacyl-tRNA hydrolase [Chloroflexi bacterium]|nr:aminoacyl-tRNA hydrolase [Chloroflexota bacterium]